MESYENCLCSFYLALRRLVGSSAPETASSNEPPCIQCVAFPLRSTGLQSFWMLSSYMETQFTRHPLVRFTMLLDLWVVVWSTSCSIVYTSCQHCESNPVMFLMPSLYTSQQELAQSPFVPASRALTLKNCPVCKRTMGKDT